MKHIDKISSTLIEAGRDPSEPVAIVTAATLPEQKVLETTLIKCVEDISSSNLKPPAIICIGKSVMMRQVLDWQSQAVGVQPRNLDPLGSSLSIESA